MALIIIPVFGSAQSLDGESVQILTLTGGVRVKLYASLENRSRYYYVPLTLQLAQGRGRSPEVSLMLYRDKDANVSGGILHALFTWGLTPVQLSEITTALLRKDSLAVLGGAADIEFKTGELECNGKDVFANELLAVSQMPVRLPREAIHKTAASFNLTANLAETFHHQLKSGPSKTSAFVGRYSYKVHRRTDIGSFGEETLGEMVLPVSTLVKVLKDYRLIKYVNL